MGEALHFDAVEVNDERKAQRSKDGWAQNF
jgi:hypothetical protein